MLKKIIDFIFSIFLIFFFLPIMLIIALFSLIILGRPIFFIQKRIGINGRIFSIIKFRTMLNKTEILQTDLQRINKYGLFLRRYSLDELPTLFNIIKGDMSLVGPRPLLPEYLNHYTLEQAQRHSVLPGITGWAQINGRNTISWEKKFDLDIWYVKNKNFYLDMYILIKTILVVLKARDISHENHVSMHRFDENKPGK